MPGDSARENGKKGGRPVGSLNQSTISKAEARELLRQQFINDLPEFYQSQKAQALGTKYLVSRDPKTGKFVPLDAEQTDLMLKCGQGDTIEVWDRPPSTPAFIALWDRALDKPKEFMELTGEDGGPVELLILSRLQAARRRTDK